MFYFIVVGARVCGNFLSIKSALRSGQSSSLIPRRFSRRLLSHFLSVLDQLIDSYAARLLLLTFKFGLFNTLRERLYYAGDAVSSIRFNTT